MQVYELITCVRRANENAGNLISVVQFLINIDIVYDNFIDRFIESRDEASVMLVLLCKIKSIFEATLGISLINDTTIEA